MLISNPAHTSRVVGRYSRSRAPHRNQPYFTSPRIHQPLSSSSSPLAAPSLVGFSKVTSVVPLPAFCLAWATTHPQGPGPWGNNPCSSQSQRFFGDMRRMPPLETRSIQAFNTSGSTAPRKINPYPLTHTSATTASLETNNEASASPESPINLQTCSREIIPREQRRKNFACLHI